FIDEIHRLNKMIEEILYPAMESSVLDIIIGKGPSARTIQIPLPKFTLVAATTRIGLLSSPLRSRFGATYHLDFYSDEEIEKIIKQSAKLLDIVVEDDGIKLLAISARKTPRVANRLLKRIRDFAQVQLKNEDNKKINIEIVQAALKLMDIDHRGLETTDRQILEIIIDKFNGGPVGIKSLTAISGEEGETIEELYEPFLLQIGFITRTPSGRVVTEDAYNHLGKTKKKQLTIDQD
ncbi:Holliday junction branch migration DNA helicase RuvB, partial [Candidatus Azambacteria bacterium]|nr:Holliday junction branch migration DNA helicase RuvB [Candidatus Azambacteria bacterium]